MSDKINKTIFEDICQPLKPFVADAVRSMQDDAANYKLSFEYLASFILQFTLSMMENEFLNRKI